MADFGRVLAVNTHNVGDQVDGAHSSDDTVLYLDDASEFPAEGGTVSTSLGLLTYDSVDADSDTLLLTDPLPGSLEDEERVDLWDADRVAVATETVASVALEGSEDDGDPFEAVVPQHLRAYLPDGIRDGGGEAVEIDVDSQAVTDVPGRTPSLDGQAVWNPHSRQTAASIRIPDDNHTMVTSWVDVETDGITNNHDGAWRVTIPAFYRMNAWLTWAPNPNGRRRVRILINGQPVRIGVQPADPDISTYTEVSTEERLAEGDVVTVWGYQRSGATLSITDGAFSMYRLSS